MKNEPPRRADAIERREQLLDAANLVFGVHGVTAPLDLVIAQAGVGRATLYRNFPDRAALMEALLQRTTTQIETRFAAAQQGDAGDFRILVELLAEFVLEAAPLADFWRTVDPSHPAMKATHERLIALATAPLERAHAAGVCNPSLRATDIPLISGILGAALRGRDPETRREMSKRTLKFLYEGLLDGAETGVSR